MEQQQAGTFICLLAYFFLYLYFKSPTSTNVDRHLSKIYLVRLQVLKSAIFFKQVLCEMFHGPPPGIFNKFPDKHHTCHSDRFTCNIKHS